MSIPKIIHYCWFGKTEKPKDIKKYICQWKKKLPDYQIIEWNETNFDINENEFVRENYKNQKWAFVSDYVRLKALYNYGGIYLDTDVELKKKFDNLLDNKMFLGFMFDCNLGTAVIGVEKNNKTIRALLNLYTETKLKNSPNNDLFTRFFLREFDEFRLNGKYQVLNNGIVIYPKEYFERATFNSKVDYADHHYKGSWYNRKDGISKKIAKLLLGRIIYSKLAHRKALKISQFYNIYLEHKKMGS